MQAKSKESLLIVQKNQAQSPIININSFDTNNDLQETSQLLQQEDEPCKKSVSTWKGTVFGATMLFLWLLVFYVGVISSQVSSLKSNIFGLSSLRFLLQFTFVVPIVIWKQCPLTIQKKHLYLIAAGMLSNVIFASSFYSVATYMPVGNLDAVHVAFYCIISVMIDLCQRSVTWKALTTALVASLGIVMVAQPWQEDRPGNQSHTSPCESLTNTSIVEIKGNLSSMDTSEQSSISDAQEAVGYFLLVLAASSITALGNFIKQLINEYPIPTVMFWLAMAETLSSFFICMVWTRTHDESYFTFPKENYCLLFTWLFIFCSGLGQSLSYLAYSYFTVSTIALCHMWVSVALYVSQRTYLKQFYPGHANAVEVVGVSIVILGTTILPATFTIVKQHQRQE